MENMMVDQYIHLEQIEAKKIVAENMDSLRSKILELESEKNILTASLASVQNINQNKAEILEAALHNLRSPLTNIQLSASLIQRYYHLLNKQKVLVHLDRILVAVNDFTILLDEFSDKRFIDTTIS